MPLLVFLLPHLLADCAGNEAEILLRKYLSSVGCLLENLLRPRDLILGHAIEGPAVLVQLLLQIVCVVPD